MRSEGSRTRVRTARSADSKRRAERDATTDGSAGFRGPARRECARHREPRQLPIYVSRLHNRQALLEADLTSERTRSEQLAQVVTDLQAPVVSLTLAQERVRSGTGIRPIDIKPSTERISVEIALASHPKALSYNVQLSAPQSTEPIWAASVLPLVSSAGDVRLKLELPARGLQAGIYTLVVSPGTATPGWHGYYDFEVCTQK